MDTVGQRCGWHLDVAEVFMADENRNTFSITVNTEYKNWLNDTCVDFSANNIKIT